MALTISFNTQPQHLTRDDGGHELGQGSVVPFTFPHARLGELAETLLKLVGEDDADDDVFHRCAHRLTDGQCRDRCFFAVLTVDIGHQTAETFAGLSLVNTRQPVKSRTYNLLEFRAEEGETPPTCSVYSSSSSPSEPVDCGRCVCAEPNL